MRRALVCSLMIAGTTLHAATAVPTFHNMSLYWNRVDGSATRPCTVEYRKAGTSTWYRAQDLVWDSLIGPRYSGSVVGLDSGTTYEFKLTFNGRSTTTVTASTWSETFPIKRTVTLPAGTIRDTYVIDQGGSASDGYVLYRAHPSGTIIDVDSTDGGEGDASDYGVEIRADYVILRGVVIRDAKRHGVFLNKGSGSGRHDVVIEGCEITNWGRRNSMAGQTITVRMKHYPDSAAAGATRFRTEAGVKIQANLGHHLDSGVRANGTEVERIVIQGNHIHHPRYTSNNWAQAAGEYFGNGNQSLHPEGPKGVVLFEPGVDVPRRGNHVVRWNRFDGDDDHVFNDVLFEAYGGAEHLRGNDARQDTDVYGNYFSHCWDDMMETERALANIRVYGNYFTRYYKGVSFYQDPGTSVGPFYLFRNVFDEMWTPNRPGTPYFDDRYVRLSGRDGYVTGLLIGENRVYEYHNLFLSGRDQGFQFVHGNDWWPGSYASNIPGETNLVARNNIFLTSATWPFDGAKTTHNVSTAPPGTLRPFDGDLHSGTIEVSSARGPRCVLGRPTWRSGHGDGSSGRYQLAAGSQGFDAGVVLPNFNDGYAGAAPDAGVQEYGAPDLVFGPANWTPGGDGGSDDQPPNAGAGDDPRSFPNDE